MMTILALLPAVFLMVYIYKKDRVEKEPVSLLIKIFVLGMLTVVPIMIMELVLDEVLLCFVSGESALYVFLETFVVVALVEEYWKRWAVRVGAWKHEAFNYRFDAIVYCVFSALGFAAVENVLYVMDGDLMTAVLRALTAVPSHAVDGVIMGYFLGEAKLRERRDDKKGRKRFLRLALFVPAVEHGIYDYALSVESEFAFVFFLLFLVVVDIWAVVFIDRSAKKDMAL